MTKKPNLQDSFIGAILGAAVGDALGAPVEGWSRETIKTVLGCVKGYQLTLLGKGVYTDETQLTLVMLNSILNCKKFSPADFGKRIGEWMRRSDDGIESARGVGKTVSLAARKLYRGIPWDQSGEYSASNGAAVRVAPLALLHNDNLNIDEFMQDVENSAKPTHIEELAIQGAKVMALAIRMILKEERFFFDRVKFLDDLIDASLTHAPKITGVIIPLKKYIGHQPIERKVFEDNMRRDAFRCQKNIDEIEDCFEILQEIGTGKYVLESVPAALYCFLNSPGDFEQTLLTAVNAGGDADSIASMAGTLSGTLNGAAAIPMRWLMDLENRDALTDLASRLHDQTLGLEMPEGMMYFTSEKYKIES